MADRVLNPYKALLGAVVIIALATTFYLPHVDGIRINRWLMLGISMLAVCSMLASCRSISSGLFILWVAFTLYISQTIRIFEPLYSTVCASVLFVAGAYSYNLWERHKNAIYNVICVIALINSTFAIMQAFGLYILLKPVSREIPIGLMSNPNELSALMAICLPFFFRRRWAYAIPLVLAGLFLAKSSNGIMAVLIITSVYMFMKHRDDRRIVLFAIVGTAMCAALYMTYIDTNHAKSFQSRAYVWGKTAQAASVKLLRGWGFGQYQYVVPLLTNPKGMSETQISALIHLTSDKAALEQAIKKVTGSNDYEGAKRYFADDKNNIKTNFAQAHNEYVELYFATGLVGILLGLSFLAGSIIRGIGQPDKIPVLCLIASASTAIFFFTWQIAPLAVITLLSLSIIHGHSKGGLSQ